MEKQLPPFFVLTAEEVNLVATTLRKHRIEVTALHNQYYHEFLHENEIEMTVYVFFSFF